MFYFEVYILIFVPFHQVQPQYRLTEESGPAHQKTFVVCLKLGKLSVTTDFNLL